MSEPVIVIDREVQFYENGCFEIDIAKSRPFTGGALKVAKSFGYMTDWEVLTLQVFCRGLPKNAILINIGAGAGTSALAMTEARQDLIHNIYTVDLYEDRGPLGGLLPERNAFDQYNTPYVHQILGDSSKIGRDWDRGPVDLVFVDGDHNGAAVERDILSWLPHVRMGGYMIFHDHGKAQWPDVLPTAQRLLVGFEFLFQIDYMGVYRISRPSRKTGKK